MEQTRKTLQPMYNQRGDTVDIAFKSSNYATPYGDNSVSGSSPGHRERHLGRSFAPNPINHSQLSHALVAPYSTELVNSEPNAILGNATSKSGCYDKSYLTYECAQEESPYETHRAHACRNNLLYADRYILNVKRAGRRHFSEMQGVEEHWVPSLRVLDKPSSSLHENAAICVQHRKPGLYNYDRVCATAIEGVSTNTTTKSNSGSCHGTNVNTAIQESLQERERRADPARHGKAHVYGPPNHNVHELGLCDLMRIRVEPNVNKSTDTEETVTTEQTKEDSDCCTLKKPDELREKSKPIACTAYAWAFESASRNECNGITKAAYESTRRPDDNEVKYIRATQQFYAAMRERERQKRQAQSNAEDIEAVRQLPPFDNEQGKLCFTKRTK